MGGLYRIFLISPTATHKLGRMNNDDKVILVYDGFCRLCSWGVAWVLARVPADDIRFVAAQSPEGAILMAKAGINHLTPETILVADGELTFIKGKAVLYLLKMCGGFSAWMAWLLGLLPSPVTDGLYAWLAARRYRWFGQLNSCYSPAASEGKKKP
jgi:predicted DCC family thiol-disulfide oxidoreductase YuxK